MSITRGRRQAGLVVVDPATQAVQSVITLQLTPDGVQRTLTPRGGADDTADAVEARRLTGPPVETITLEAELDAVELASTPLAPGADVVAEVGLHAALAELENLLRPRLTDVLDGHALAASGAFEVLGPPQPDLLLVWGRQRIVPVRLTDLSVTEESYDGELNPLRATVSLSLRVLSVNDVGVDSPAGSWSLAHHAARERLAEMVRSRSTGRLGVDL